VKGALNTAMNRQATLQAGNSFRSWGTVSFSRGNVLNCANHLQSSHPSDQKTRPLANRPYPEPSHTSQIYIFLVRFILIVFSSTCINTKASQSVLHTVSLHDCDVPVHARRHDRLMLLQYVYRYFVCFNPYPANVENMVSS
jgi:hypothetical protein